MLRENEKKAIALVVKAVCEEMLHIEIPPVIYKRIPEMTAPNQQILTTVGGNSYATIFIDPALEWTNIIVCAVAHELRHIKQYYDVNFDARKYKQPHELTFEEYNLQPEEIDANAFGEIAMLMLTDSKPRWNGMTEKIKAAIGDRKREILKTEFGINNVENNVE